MEIMTKEKFGDRLLETANYIIGRRNPDGTYTLTLHGGGDDDAWRFEVYRAKLKIEDILVPASQVASQVSFKYEGCGASCDMKHALGDDVPIHTDWGTT